MLNSIEKWSDQDVAQQSRWDVVVVGAGPAGAIAARETARRGATVLLIDKAIFPRWKVCGCCLNGAALAALVCVGLGDLPERLSARSLNRWQLHTRNCQATCTLPTGASLSREALDAALVEHAIEGGVEFVDGTNASLVRRDSTGCIVELSNGSRQVEVCGQVLIAADGLAGRVVANLDDFVTTVHEHSRMGAGTVLNDGPDFYQDGTIYMSCGKGGYVGLVRLENGRLDIAAALDRRVVRELGTPAEAAVKVMRDVNLPIPDDMLNTLWRGTPTLTRKRNNLASERIFVIGDAAGYIEPFTGEGIAWALLSGIAVAPLAFRGSRQWTLDLAAQWSRIHRKLLGRRQWSCHMIGKLLRTPILANTAARVLKLAPSLAGPMIRAINQPIKPPIHLQDERIVTS